MPTLSIVIPAKNEEQGLALVLPKLRELYPDNDNLDIARRLGRSVASVANKANQLGLHKSAALLARIGRKNVAVRYTEND